MDAIIRMRSASLPEIHQHSSSRRGDERNMGGTNSQWSGVGIIPAPARPCLLGNQPAKFSCQSPPSVVTISAAALLRPQPRPRHVETSYL